MIFGKRIWSLEIGPATLRLAALQRSRDRARVEILDRARMHPESRTIAPAEFREAALETLREWRRRHGIRRREPLAVVVPGLRGLITTLHLPHLQEDKLAELVRHEVHSRMRSPRGALAQGDFSPGIPLGDLDDEIAHAWREEAGPTETTGRTLIAAWPQELLASYLGLLADAGLRPDLVTFTPLADRALLQFDRHQDGTSWHPDENIWILRIGNSLVDWSSSTFEGFFSVTRSCGAGRLMQLVKHETCLDAARALAITEDLLHGIPPSVPTVEIALERYYDELIEVLEAERNHRRKEISTTPGRIVVLGRAGGMVGLVRRLQRHFNVPVKPLTSLHRIELREGAFDPHLREELSDFLPALGAGFSLDWATAPLVALHRSDGSKPIERSAPRRLLLAAALVLACAWFEWRAHRPAELETAPSSAERMAAELDCFNAGRDRYHRIIEHLHSLESIQGSREHSQLAHHQLIAAWSRIPAEIEIRSQRWIAGAETPLLEVELCLPIGAGRLPAEIDALNELLGRVAPAPGGPALPQSPLAEAILAVLNADDTGADGGPHTRPFPRMALAREPELAPHPANPGRTLMRLALCYEIPAGTAEGDGQ